MQSHIILLSIMPQYVKQILAGSKRYEFRRSIPKHPIDQILVYETKPKAKVVALIQIKQTLKDSVSNLWANTNKFAGIEKDKFFKYFENQKCGYCFEIAKVEKLNDIDLADLNIKCPPQGFVYLSEQQIKRAKGER